MRTFQIIRYDNSLKSEWDSFIDSSKNGTFLFKRNYMDYHSDRFPDHSLLFLCNERIIATLPATSNREIFSSHSGLTYGGLVTTKHTTTADVIEIFQLILSYLKENGFNTFVYKPVPHIYHTIPAEEDLYALYKLNASLKARCISSTILQADALKFRNIRKYGIRKALKNDIYIQQCSDFTSFWKILETNLALRFDTKPVHTLREIGILSSRFPDEIKLHVAKKGNKTLAGVVMYITKTVAHTQYIATSPEGRESGALDLLFNTLINDVYSNLRFFDFGISTENGGKYLNETLIYQKEGFGGRAICYDTYELQNISN